MTMKRLTVRSRAVIGTTALCLATVLRIDAQTTAPAPAAAETTDDKETIVLSPFVVQAEEDTGYSATSTLAGTRVRTELKDVGSAIQVVTQKFLQDTNSRNAADLLVYTTSTEVAGQGGNFTGAGDTAVLDTTAYTSPNPNTRVRGLAAADNLRDFFLTDIPWDSYNVGRVELQRGANSVLFGIGSPAGIINSSIDGATFRNDNKVEFQLGSFGSHREVVSLNKVLIKDTLAVRLSVLNDGTKYKQKPAFRDDQRIFGALRWDPKVFNDDTHTSIRVNYEKGDIEANQPRLTPPMDSITPWFSSMNRATFAYQNSNNLTTFGNAQYNPWLGAAGNRIWDGLAATFNADSPTQGLIFAANVRDYPAADASRNNTVNGSYKGIQAYNSYASNARLTGYVIQPFKAKSLTDASIFDFYNNLIEGDNKRNWNEFDAFNASIAQTFFNDKLGFEVAYDNQDATWAYRNAISGDAAAITIDVMSTFADGSANPNVGRAMLIAGGGSAGSGWTNRTRETVRATAFGELNFNDILGRDSTAAKILGKHNFTVAYTDYTDETLQKNWVNWYINAGGYGPIDQTAVGQAGRDATPVIYLSGDLRGTSSASGLNLTRVNASIVPQAGTVRQWDTNTMTFINYPVSFATPSQDSGPYTNASLNRNNIESKVAVWQAHLLNGILVPMFGWREDEAIALNAGTPSKTLGLVDSLNPSTWHLPTDENDTANGRTWDVVTGKTKTYSLVAHVPKSLTDRLPGKVGVSFFYNKSENFQPDASRKDVLGASIAAPEGKTEDYGVTFTALEGRLALKVNRYETSVTNATLNSGGLGNVYLIGAGEAWGQAAAYQLSINSGNWPGDGNYGVTSAGSAFGAGHILRWQPADDPANHVIPGDNTSPYTQAAINAQYDIQRRSTDDWMANQLPASFQQAWGMTGYATGSGSWSQNTVHVTGDTMSKGTEFELIATDVLVKGLSVSLNAAKTDARRLSIAKAYSEWIEQRWVDYQGPMGDMRLWGNGNWALTVGSGGTVRDKFNNEVMPNYKLALALNGSNVPELRPWRFNTVANYTFQEGRFKGANVGVSYRWQDKQVTGYKLNAANDGYDIEDPYFGPTEDSVDLWVGFEKKITDRIKWRAQINVRDVFATKTLIPVTVQPDGSPGAYRIPEPRTWTFTNTFSF